MALVGRSYFTVAPKFGTLVDPERPEATTRTAKGKNHWQMTRLSSKESDLYQTLHELIV